MVVFMNKKTSRVSKKEKEFRKVFSKRLKSERGRLGIHVERMSELLNIHISTQFRYEAGAALPNIYYIHQLGNLGFDLNYILDIKA